MKELEALANVPLEGLGQGGTLVMGVLAQFAEYAAAHKDSKMPTRADIEPIIAKRKAPLHGRLVAVQAEFKARGIKLELDPESPVTYFAPDRAASALADALRVLGSADGFVAFVDLLGFSRRVAHAASEEFFVAYEEALARALDVPSNVEYVVSSDNIVLYNKKPGDESLVEICETTARLFWELLHIQVPVRGAISCGRFRETRTERGTIVAGPPILDAYEYEQKQDWLGIMLTPRLIEQNPQIFRRGTLRREVVGNQEAESGPRLMRPYSIPFKFGAGSEPYSGYALLPNPHTRTNRGEGKVALEEALRSVRAMSRFAPDAGSQRKYEAAEQFLVEAACDYK